MAGFIYLTKYTGNYFKGHVVTILHKSMHHNMYIFIGFYLPYIIINSIYYIYIYCKILKLYIYSLFFQDLFKC